LAGIKICKETDQGLEVRGKNMGSGGEDKGRTPGEEKQASLINLRRVLPEGGRRGRWR